MTTVPGTRALSIALVAMLASACLAVGTSAADAASLPRTVPMVAAFDNLSVGDTASRSWDIELPLPALLTSADVHRTGEGRVRWSATLCPASGAACTNLLTARTGATLAAGHYQLALGVTVLALDVGESQTIDGRLTFVQHGPSGLAATGSDVVRLALWAATAVALGLLLVLAVRRRRAARLPDTEPVEDPR